MAENMAPISKTETDLDAKLKAEMAAKYGTSYAATPAGDYAGEPKIPVPVRDGKLTSRGTYVTMYDNGVASAAAARAEAEGRAAPDMPAPDIAPPVPPQVPAAPPVGKKSEESALEKLQNRIAEMEDKWNKERTEFETRLAVRTAEPERPIGQSFNPAEHIPLQELMLDPAGTFRKHGVDFQAVAASLVAAELGPNADPAIRARAGYTPQQIAVSQQLATLSNSNRALLDRLDKMDEESKDAKYNAELTAYAIKPDLVKFPLSAQAAANDAALVATMVQQIAAESRLIDPRTGKKAAAPAPEKVVEALEKRFAAAAALLKISPTPTSTQGAPAGTSTQPPATANTLVGTAPLVPTVDGPDEAERKLREDILRKYTR